MSYDYGRFVWFELMTNDADKAAAFYPETLPWKIAPTIMRSAQPLTRVVMALAKSAMRLAFDSTTWMPCSCAIIGALTMLT